MQTETITKPVQNLTKENFWNDLHQQFPRAMTCFCKWVDDYKKKNNWDVLFGSLFPTYKQKIQYHDLPYAMQAGIWMEFVFDQAIYWEFKYEDLKDSIRTTLAYIEEEENAEK